MTTLARPTLDLYDSWAECVKEFEPGHIPAAALWLLDRKPEVSRNYCADLVVMIEAVAILDRLLHHCDVLTINGPATDSKTACHW